MRWNSSVHDKCTWKIQPILSYGRSEAELAKHRNVDNRLEHQSSDYILEGGGRINRVVCIAFN